MLRQMMEETLRDKDKVVPGASTFTEEDDAFRRGKFDVALLDLSWGPEGPVAPHLPRWCGMQPAARVSILTATDE
jgi:DNA-binding response OmpR family regulator